MTTNYANILWSGIFIFISRVSTDVSYDFPVWSELRYNFLKVDVLATAAQDIGYPRNCPLPYTAGAVIDFAAFTNTYIRRSGLRNDIAICHDST